MGDHKKADLLSQRGIIVFSGQAHIFASYSDAERYAESLVRDTDDPIKFATLVPNTPTAERTLMEQAVVVVDRGIVAATAEEAVNYDYLTIDPDPEED